MRYVYIAFKFIQVSSFPNAEDTSSVLPLYFMNILSLIFTFYHIAKLLQVVVLLGIVSHGLHREYHSGLYLSEPAQHPL